MNISDAPLWQPDLASVHYWDTDIRHLGQTRGLLAVRNTSDGCPGMNGARHGRPWGQNLPLAGVAAGAPDCPVHLN